MKDTLADILLALYLNGGTGTMAWLGSYFTSRTPAEIRMDIFLLASSGLVSVHMDDDDAHATLTDMGSAVALEVADILSSHVLDHWRRESVA